MSVLEPARRLRSIATRRSLLPPPRDATDPRWEASWRHLVEAYAPAMRRYVVALLAPLGLQGNREAHAEEIVQDYLLACLEKGWLAQEDEIRCFRAWLQVQLRRFTIGWLRRRSAAKRGPLPGLGPETLDRLEAPARDADADLDVAFVQTALQRALSELHAGNPQYAEIIGDLLLTAGQGSPDLAARLGRPPGQLAVLRHRARRRFAVLFADELRSTVRDEAALEDLLRQLAPHLP